MEFISNESHVASDCDMKRGGDADASRPDFTQRLQAANVLSYDTALFTVVFLELFDNFFNKSLVWHTTLLPTTGE